MVFCVTMMDFFHFYHQKDKKNQVTWIFLIPLHKVFKKKRPTTLPLILQLPLILHLLLPRTMTATREQYQTRNAFIRDYGYPPMSHLCMLGDVIAMQFMYQLFPEWHQDLRTPDTDGITPMFLASQENQVEAMQWLFDHGAQEDVRTPERWCHTHVRLQVKRTTWKQCSGCLIMVRKKMFEHQTTMVSHPCGLQVKKQRGSNAVVV